MINNLKIKQNPSLFCFGTDAVLLANFAVCKNSAKILDIGTGNGIIPILLSAKLNAKSITGLEIQKESASLARENIEFNNLGKLINIVHGDINDESLFSPCSFDYITCNPPYKEMGTGIKNPSSPLAIARHEICCTLEDIIRRSSFLLNSKGKIAMVHKPQRLAEIIYIMKKYKIEAKRLLNVCSREGESPCLILIEGVKDGGKGLTIHPSVYIYDKNGNYTACVKDLYNKRL